MSKNRNGFVSISVGIIATIALILLISGGAGYKYYREKKELAEEINIELKTKLDIEKSKLVEESTSTNQGKKLIQNEWSKYASLGEYSIEELKDSYRQRLIKYNISSDKKEIIIENMQDFFIKPHNTSFSFLHSDENTDENTLDSIFKSKVLILVTGAFDVTCPPKTLISFNIATKKYNIMKISKYFIKSICSIETILSPDGRFIIVFSQDDGNKFIGLSQTMNLLDLKDDIDRIIVKLSNNETFNALYGYCDLFCNVPLRHSVEWINNQKLKFGVYDQSYMPEISQGYLLNRIKSKGYDNNDIIELPNRAYEDAFDIGILDPKPLIGIREISI